MLNPRQEKFVSLYAAGQTAAQAYSRAGHSAEASHVAALTSADILGHLRDMLETPISALDENQPYARRMIVTEAG